MLNMVKLLALPPTKSWLDFLTCISRVTDSKKYLGQFAAQSDDYR